MAKRIGNRTVELETKVCVESYASVVGPKEKEGPLGKGFDKAFDDEFLGEDSFEKAESRLQTIAVETTLKKADVTAADVDIIYAGDLLNQCIGSAYGLKSFEIPYVGLYGACSTMALSAINASLAIESGAAEKAVAVTSSHFCSSERQFRFPLEYGGQRTPTSQWTVTGSGAILLGKTQKGPRIKSLTIGKIVDLGVDDMNNMGAAMAPDDVKIRPYPMGDSIRDLDRFLNDYFRRSGVKNARKAESLSVLFVLPQRKFSVQKPRHTQMPPPPKAWSFSTHKLSI